MKFSLFFRKNENATFSRKAQNSQFSKKKILKKASCKARQSFSLEKLFRVLHDAFSRKSTKKYLKRHAVRRCFKTSGIETFCPKRAKSLYTWCFKTSPYSVPFRPKMAIFDPRLLAKPALLHFFIFKEKIKIRKRRKTEVFTFLQENWKRYFSQSLVNSSKRFPSGKSFDRPEPAKRALVRRRGPEYLPDRANVQPTKHFIFLRKNKIFKNLFSRRAPKMNFHDGSSSGAYLAQGLSQAGAQRHQKGPKSRALRDFHLSQPFSTF